MTPRGLLHNWPVKLAALLVGALAWYLVGLGSDEIGQTTLSVPVTVVGLSENQTPIGVPETVLVEASGRSNRVTRLRAENFDATLDLSGVSGSFQQQVEVVAPQGITVLRVTPTEASGTVETISSERWPVTVGLLEPLPSDSLLHAGAEPAEVTVRGRGSVLERLAAVRAVTSASPGTQQVPLVLVDAEGHPLDELSSDPAAVAVTVSATPVLHQKAVPLSVAPPEVEGFTVEGFALTQETLSVAGTTAALEGLEALSGRVEPITGTPEAGEYTLAVEPELPEGVVATETVRARFQLVPVGDANPDDGVPDDLPSAPLRRPNPAQDGQPGTPLR